MYGERITGDGLFNDYSLWRMLRKMSEKTGREMPGLYRI